METLPGLPFIGDQVVCLSHDQAARSGPASMTPVGFRPRKPDALVRRGVGAAERPRLTGTVASAISDSGRPVAEQQGQPLSRIEEPRQGYPTKIYVSARLAPSGSNPDTESGPGPRLTHPIPERYVVVAAWSDLDESGVGIG